MHKKSILIIIILTFVVFGNSLFNGFVGDDHSTINYNNFFRSWENVPRLFQIDYILDEQKVFNHATEDLGTGEVSYRPVYSLTYFFDYALWKLNPFGYHLHGVILHILTVICLYALIYLIFRQKALALLSAVVFAIHPLKSEAVCAIGYRGDILACLFVLAAFICYIKHERKYLIGAHILFFLALFTKESAAPFPAVLIAYDYFIRQEKFKKLLKEFTTRYLGFAVILAFYLYVYFFVFPNEAVKNTKLMGGGIIAHISISLVILKEYLISFINPFSVGTLIPFYYPPLDQLANYEIPLSVGMLILLIIIFVRFRRYNKRLAFFVLWFALFYLPVSNAIMMVNPIAYRFMYMPSIGLIIPICYGFIALNDYLKTKSRYAALTKILIISYCLLCAISTAILNMGWKNDRVKSFEMVKSFPKAPMGYLYKGMTYFYLGQRELALETLLKAQEMGLHDFRAYRYIGLCYLNEPEKAKPYYERCTKEYPFYAPCYEGLGRCYLFEKDFQKSVSYLEEAIKYKQNYSSYGYLIQSYILSGQPGKAQNTLMRAKEHLGHTKNFESLENLISRESQLTEPVDIRFE